MVDENTSTAFINLAFMDCEKNGWLYGKGNYCCCFVSKTVPLVH